MAEDQSGGGKEGFNDVVRTTRRTGRRTGEVK